MIKKAIWYCKVFGFWRTLQKVYLHLSFKIKVLFYKNTELTYKMSRPENKYVRLKEKHIYLFMCVPCYDIGGGQRGAQLAKTFNKMGYLINYFYLYDSGESKRVSVDLPLNTHCKLDKSPIKMTLEPGDICIFEAPAKEFMPYIEMAAASKCKIIYECIDNWETNLGKSFYDSNILKCILEKADIITATSMPLVNQQQLMLSSLGLNKKVYYLPNAVDSDMFNPEGLYKMPRDMAIAEKTLLYYGSLWGSWFDWELIFEVARVPGVVINLIGDFATISHIAAKAPKNIHFLGLKSQRELPAYLYFCDYALLPFKPDEVGQYVSPLKIFEYIAMGKPVLATGLEDIKGYPNTIISNSAKDWIKELSNVRELEPWNEFVADNNWYKRCETLLLAVTEGLASDSWFYGRLSVVILNYNNKNVIFRCIDSLLKYAHGYDYDIIVIDNQSTDGSYELLWDRYGGNNRVKLGQNDKNGCSSGRNLGVSMSDKDYTMFLDSDQWVLYANWLDPYLEVLSANKSVGAIGWAGGWFNSEGYAYHVVDSFPYRYMPPMGLCRTDIGYLGTGGMMLERELFDAIDGFDVNYDPTCYEDTDISLKIRNSGREIVYCPYLGVGHKAHQTTKSGSEAHEKLIRSKGDYFVAKWKKLNPSLLKYTK